MDGKWDEWGADFVCYSRQFAALQSFDVKFFFAGG